MTSKCWLLWISMMAILAGCYNKFDRSSPFDCIYLGDGIYREVFVVLQGGVYTGEIYSDYITDSASFRYFVGEIDDHQEHIFSIEDGMLEITKVEIMLKGYDTLSSYRYSILDLPNESCWNERNTCILSSSPPAPCQVSNVKQLDI